MRTGFANYFSETKEHSKIETLAKLKDKSGLEIESGGGMNPIGQKKRRHRTATTAYPCSLPDLGDSAGAGRAADTNVIQKSAIPIRSSEFGFITQEIKH